MASVVTPIPKAFVFYKEQLPGTIMCLHNDLERTGAAETFTLRCLSCGLIISTAEDGCKHYKISMNGTIQYGPRMKCALCQTLLLRNVSGSARFIPKEKSIGVNLFRRKSPCREGKQFD